MAIKKQGAVRSLLLPIPTVMMLILAVVGRPPMPVAGVVGAIIALHAGVAIWLMRRPRASYKVAGTLYQLSAVIAILLLVPSARGTWLS